MATLRQSLQKQAPDIAAFADHLSAIFGAPLHGLVMVIRATPEYKAWRRTVEYCAVCKTYAPLHRLPVSGHRFKTHRSPSGNLCPNSGAHTCWTGDHGLDVISRDHLLRLLGVVAEQNQPPKEEVQLCND